MKRQTKLLFLAMVLMVMATAAFVVAKLSPENEDTFEDTSVAILSLDTETVSALSWSYEGESLTFAYADGAWYYPEDSTFPLDDSYLDDMVDELSDVVANRTIEAVTDLSQYGLEDAVCTISVTADAVTTEIRIGNENSLGGQRYLSLGDGMVYLVDALLLDEFSYGLYDLVRKEPIPPMTNVSDVRVKTGTQTLSLTKQTVGESYAWQAGDQFLDTELTDAFVETVTHMSWDACVDYKADDILTEYGLDVPMVSVAVAYIEPAAADETSVEKVDFAVEIGSRTGEFCYARLAGSEMVYLIDGTICDVLLQTTVESLIS